MTLSGWVLSGPISSVTWFITEVSSRLPAKSLATTFDDSTGNPFATAKRRSISVVCAPVSTIAEGRKLCNILADYDLFQYENHIKPDYANAGGVARYEDDGEGGADWFDVFDDEEDAA